MKLGSQISSHMRTFDVSMSLQDLTLYDIYYPPPPLPSLQREQSQVILTSLRNRKAESELQDLNPSKKIRIVHLFYWALLASMCTACFPDDVRLPVSTEDFESYVKSMHANTDHLFSEEYEVRPPGHVIVVYGSHDSHKIIV